MDRMQRFRIAYFMVVWAVVVALIVQVSLIGLWLFSGQPTLGIHMEFGHAITLMVLGLLILAFTGRLPRSMRLRTVLLAGLMALQTEVFAFIPGSPLRAFHSVLPLVIFALILATTVGLITVRGDSLAQNSLTPNYASLLAPRRVVFPLWASENILAIIGLLFLGVFLPAITAARKDLSKMSRTVRFA